MLKYVFTKFIIVIWIISPAQVQVRNEPRHHNVFENQYLRILDVHLGPKDTTEYHLHNTPSVFILLSNCRVSSQLLGGQPQSGANISGIITYDNISKPRTHRVWNEDTVWFHVIDVELIAGQPKNKVELLDDDELKVLFNESLVTGYKVKASKGQKISIPPSASGYLFVSLGNAVIDISGHGPAQQRFMKAGHYEWLDGKDLATITSNSIADFVLLQLK